MIMIMMMMMMMMMMMILIYPKTQSARTLREAAASHTAPKGLRRDRAAKQGDAKPIISPSLPWKLSPKMLRV